MVVFLDNVGESKCTRGLTLLIVSRSLYHPMTFEVPKFVARVTILFLFPVLLILITLQAGMFMKSGL